ncbi:MAG: large-conductance mechanosensitive channel protein MscL [Caulobacteraceae bacterium]
MLKDFREFIARGNVVDLAVAVIIGAAFGAVVKSLVDQVIMPPIGLAAGGIDFSRLKVVLKAAAPGPKGAEVAIAYGAFINTVITFLIIAIVVFLLVRLISALRREQKAEPATPAPTTSEALLAEIRDLLREAPPGARKGAQALTEAYAGSKAAGGAAPIQGKARRRPAKSIP